MFNFKLNNSGSMIIPFAIMLPVLMMLLGGTIDLMRLSYVTAVLQNSADLAVVEVVAEKSKAMQAVAARSGASGEVAIGETEAVSLVSRDLYLAPEGQDINITPDVSYDQGVLQAHIKITGNVTPYFMSFFGYTNLKVQIDADAEFRPLVYTDFYLLIDNSPSMALGASPDDSTRIQTLTGCTFACHITNSTTDSYSVAKSNGVTLRINSVTNAVKSMLTKASSSRLNADQFRFEIYSLGNDAKTAGLTKVYGMSNNIDAALLSANSIDLMSIPYQGYYFDQLTDLSTALTSLRGIIGKSGAGLTASDPQKVLLLISDGMEDAYRPNGCVGIVESGTRCHQGIDVSVCTQIKANSVRIGTVYTTYQSLTDGYFWAWIRPILGTVGPNMKSCASTGLYAEVTPTSDVGAKLQALFTSINSMPRLVQ